MARLYSSGFELNSTTNSFDFHSQNGGAGTIVTSPVRSGTYAMQTNGLVSGTAKRFSFRHIGFEAAGHWFFRIYLNVNTRPNATNTIMKWAGTNNVLFVKLKSDGTLELSDEVGVIGTSSALTNDQWYRIEVEFDDTTGAGLHVARLRIDGTIAVESSSRTFTHTTIQQTDLGGNLGGETQTVGNWYWDDFGVNDTTGSFQNSWLGEGHIIHLRPNANGDANVNVTRGGADSGADWSQLDEVTPNDVTDYMELTSTTSVVWTNVDNSGLGGAYVIPLVAVGGRITIASAGTGNWFPSIKSQSGGVTLDGSPVSITSTSWFAHDDTTGSQQYKVTAYVDPQDGGSWTTARVDGIQIGAKTTDGSPATRVTAIWALVEYIVQTVSIPPVLDNGIIAGLQRFDGGLR